MQEKPPNKKETSDRSRTTISIFYLLGSFLFFFAAAGGQTIFGNTFHGDVLLAPAWGMFFVPFFYVVGVKGINALVSILRLFAAGIVTATKEDKSEEN